MLPFSWRRLIAIAFLCLPAGAYAMVVPLSIEQLSRDADAIVVGKVVAVTAERRGALIYSMARIKVEQAVKGNTLEEVTVESLGGRIGEQVLAVSETTTYAAGERVVVFLRKAEKAEVYHTVGVRQGKLLVQDGMVTAHNLSLEALLRRVRAVLVESGK
jgi:hypothetical protein